MDMNNETYSVRILKENSLNQNKVPKGVWIVAMLTMLAISYFYSSVYPLLVMGVAYIYVIPSIVGWHKKNCTAILVLNLFLGWTFLGWVVALVWACMED